MLPLRIDVPALPARGGPALVRRLLEPLGWSVQALALPLDGHFPEWGDPRYVSLVLDGRLRLSEALRHLYVLLGPGRREAVFAVLALESEPVDPRL